MQRKKIKVFPGKNISLALTSYRLPGKNSRRLSRQPHVQRMLVIVDYAVDAELKSSGLATWPVTSSATSTSRLGNLFEEVVDYSKSAGVTEDTVTALRNTDRG